MTKEMKQIFTRRITHATYLKDAAAAQSIGCRQEFKKGMQCARNCISELRCSLDFNYDLSRNLFAIYAFADRELAHDMNGIRAEQLDQIIGMFQKLRDAYHTISREDQSRPLMENAQDVYAGLTYSKTDVNESLLQYGTARGFCV